MIFKKRHNNDLYNILLILARNKFFYLKIKLKDTFETRIHLMFLHFAIILKIFKKRNEKFDQKQYDNLFHSIENNLRELGFGDVSVNDKMKTLNKILYDILLKIEKTESSSNFQMEPKLIIKYFKEINDIKSEEFKDFNNYFVNFFDYCFELSSESMLKELKNFIY